MDDARLKGSYTFKNLLKPKAILTFGSDRTVTPLKPRKECIMPLKEEHRMIKTLVDSILSNIFL